MLRPARWPPREGRPRRGTPRPRPRPWEAAGEGAHTHFPQELTALGLWTMDYGHQPPATDPAITVRGSGGADPHSRRRTSTGPYWPGSPGSLPPRHRPRPRGPAAVGSQTHAPGGGFPRAPPDLRVKGTTRPGPAPGDDGPWGWEHGPTSRAEDAHGARSSWEPWDAGRPGPGHGIEGRGYGSPNPHSWRRTLAAPTRPDSTGRPLATR